MWIDGHWKIFGNGNRYFKKEDFVGIGIIHHLNMKMECFATLNGELLGKIINKLKNKNVKSKIKYC